MSNTCRVIGGRPGSQAVYSLSGNLEGQKLRATGPCVSISTDTAYTIDDSTSWRSLNRRHWAVTLAAPSLFYFCLFRFGWWGSLNTPSAPAFAQLVKEKDSGARSKLNSRSMGPAEEFLVTST